MTDMNSDKKPPQHQPIYGTNNNTPLIGVRKRQQPILTCTAHVFQIDPITKKSWIPSSTTALPVSFFYDASRGVYRIIGTDGNKTFVNSTILPGMNFTKTSQKFGQWSDKQTNTVYGLGFSGENELEKFDEQFQIVKDTLARTNAGAPTINSNIMDSPAKHNMIYHVNGINSHHDTQSQLMTTTENGTDNNNYATITSNGNTTTMDMNANAVYQTAGNINNNNNAKLNSNNNSNNLNNGGILKSFNNPPPGYLGSPAKVLRLNQQQQLLNGTGNSNSTIQNIYNSPKHTIYTPVSKLINESVGDSQGKMSQETMQLKYENERLRQALQQSSANAKMWEYELSNLKINNAKLTTALQECNVNVEDWKHQLQKYKEENQTLRLKILDIEAEVGKSGSVQASMGESELGKQLDGLRSKVNYYSKLIDEKDEHINCIKLKSSLANYNINGDFDNNELKMNTFTNENDKGYSQNEDGDILWTSIQTVHSQLQTTIETQDFQKKVLEALAVQLSTKLSDLTHIQDKMKDALESSLR